MIYEARTSVVFATLNRGYIPTRTRNSQFICAITTILPPQCDINATSKLLASTRLSVAFSRDLCIQARLHAVRASPPIQSRTSPLPHLFTFIHKPQLPPHHLGLGHQIQLPITAGPPIRNALDASTPALYPVTLPIPPKLPQNSPSLLHRPGTRRHNDMVKGDNLHRRLKACRSSYPSLGRTNAGRGTTPATAISKRAPATSLTLIVGGCSSL